MDGKTKLSALKTRKFGEDYSPDQLFENFEGTVSDQLLYVTESMRPVERSYTENTYKQCVRVQDQIKSNINHIHSGIDFQYQGSVPLNTHIKRHSDVDILIATGRYHWVTLPLTPDNPYLGNAKNDLIELRKDVVDTIQNTFPAVDIDDTGGKAVAICGGSLNRKMDLVPISWVHNVQSTNSRDFTYRGIKLYDKNNREYITNYPFLHIYRCDQKDSYVDGKFKKIVRYVKNVIKDSDRQISISSYDATALMFHLGNSELMVTANDPARLSALTEAFLLKVINDPSFRISALVPNETRPLFDDKGLKLDEVVKLYEEIKEINYSVLVSYLSINRDQRYLVDQYFQKN